MNKQEMMEEIDRLARLCEEKDAENKKLHTTLSGQTCFVPPEFQRQLSEAQAQIAMQDAALNECRMFIKCEEIPSREVLEAIETSISATAETVAAFRAKETEPLRREVAICADFAHDIANEIFPYPGQAVRKADEFIQRIQSTALACELEVENRGAVKALEDAAEYFAQQDWREYATGKFVEDELMNRAAELRANKGEVK